MFSKIHVYCLEKFVLPDRSPPAKYKPMGFYIRVGFYMEKYGMRAWRTKKALIRPWLESLRQNFCSLYFYGVDLHLQCTLVCCAGALLKLKAASIACDISLLKVQKEVDKLTLPEAPKYTYT